MNRRSFVLRAASFIALLAFSISALAALTAPQIATLRTAVLTEPTLATARNTGDDAAIANWLNAIAATPYIVWRSRVPFQEVADATSAADLGAMTASNVSRYSTLMQVSPNGIVPTADRRAGFEDIFGGTAGATTRTKLGNAGTVWKRQASRAEGLLATGTGTDASPGTLTFEGVVTPVEAGMMR
jgi:hypothetical protein